MFLVVLGWAFLRGPVEGAVWAFIGGLLLDVFSGGPFGAFALSLSLVALFVGQKWGRELGSLFLQLVLIALIACFLYHVSLLLILAGVGHPVNWSYSLSQVAAPSTVLNAALAPFIYWPLAWLHQRTRSEGFTLDGA